MTIEYTAQQVQEEVNQVAAVLKTTASTLSSNPEVWILFAGLLYRWLTRPVPLLDHPTDVAKQDLKRYNLMCANYLRILKKPDIPIHWKSDRTRGAGGLTVVSSLKGSHC